MPTFTAEELNLICLYDPGSRKGTIYELNHMKDALMPDETTLKRLVERTVRKLKRMNDQAFEQLSEELYAQYDPFDDLDLFDDAMLFDDESLLDDRSLIDDESFLDDMDANDE